MQFTNFCFTIFGDAHASDPYLLYSEGYIRYIQWQIEMCPTTERLHAQGFLILERKRRVGPLLKQLRKTLTHKGIHLEVARGSIEENRTYCTKAETRIDGPFELGDEPAQGERTDFLKAIEAIDKCSSMKEVLRTVPTSQRYLKWTQDVFRSREKAFPKPNIELYAWQEEVLKITNEPHETRKIIWIWSEGVNTGKSTFSQFLLSTYPGAIIGDPTNIANTMLMIAEDQPWTPLVLFDMAKETPLDAHFYSQIETMSNIGVKLSGKYVSINKYFAGHVVVFSNRPPNHERLQQRFIEFNITQNE